MFQIAARRSQVPTLVALLTLGACRGATNPRTGALEVYASFTCVSQLACDSDGFVIALDNRAGQRMTAFADTLADIPVGQHTLTLSDVQSNCTVSGANPLLLIVKADTTVQAGWAGNCQ